jgi:hypothetical protein
MQITLIRQSVAVTTGETRMVPNRETAVEVVQSVYEAVGRRDVEQITDVLADDVEWVEPDGGPVGGTYHGPDAVVANVFTELEGEWAEFAVEPDRFLVDGETVVALVTHRGTHAETGERFEAPIADVWDLADGEVTRFQHYVGDVHYVQARQERPRDAGRAGDPHDERER